MKTMFNSDSALPRYEWRHIVPGDVVRLQPPMPPSTVWMCIGRHVDPGITQPLTVLTLLSLSDMRITQILAQ